MLRRLAAVLLAVAAELGACLSVQALGVGLSRTCLGNGRLSGLHRLWLGCAGRRFHGGCRRRRTGGVVVVLGVVVVVLGVAVCAMALTLKRAAKAAVVNIVAIRMGLFLR